MNGFAIAIGAVFVDALIVAASLRWDAEKRDAVITVAAILIGILVGLWIYFIPTLIAYRRGHRNKVGIFMLNLFLGWPLIGWVGALIWALHVERSVPLYVPEGK